MFQLNRRVLLSLPHCGQVLKCLVVKHVVKENSLRTVTCSVQNWTKNKNVNILFRPLEVKPEVNEMNAGAELAGNLDKLTILKIINSFFRTSELKIMAEESGLDDYLLHKGFTSFRKYCLETEDLPTELHIIFSDISKKAANHLDLFPYFVAHVRKIFPHLECMDDLKKISDLRAPANWYAETRPPNRKIIFHSGPTNSGKTYHALQSFMKSKSGVYCGPLKLLVFEIYQKANANGVPCDLLTGEEVICSGENGDFSSHVSCTVEMVSMENQYDVAVIDEIQMIKDHQRGWAWTRALLGLRAKEIHLCGEESAVGLIDSILCTTNEKLEVKKYERLTSLSICESVEDLTNVEPGDCIVCFNKTDIFKLTQAFEKIGKDVAVIYGALPPGTKLAQCKKFNDPENPCNILIATDAIGMGLNLCIRRIIFYSLMKISASDKGELEVNTISVSHALQIAGRAGRYGSRYSEGFVTTFKAKDLPLLKDLLSKSPEPVFYAGLHPTIDQIELYSFYLPNLPLSNLLEIFIKMCTVDDSMYFICDIKDLKYLAEMLEHVNLPLRVKYVFCCSPINRKLQFTCTMLLKFAKLYSENRPITFNWLCNAIDWPVKTPMHIRELILLEAVHDVLEVYLWLGNRFPEYFPDSEHVKNIQLQVDRIIQNGVVNMSKLLKAAPKRFEYSSLDEEESLNDKNFSVMEDELESEEMKRGQKNILNEKYLA